MQSLLVRGQACSRYCIRCISGSVHRLSQSSPVRCGRVAFLGSAGTCPFLAVLFLLPAASQQLVLLLCWGYHLDGSLPRLSDPPVEAIAVGCCKPAGAGVCTRGSCPFEGGESPLLHCADAVSTCDRGRSGGQFPFDSFFEHRSCFPI